VQVLLEGVHLPAERVAPDRDVETAEGLLVGPGVGDAVGQHDHAGARAVGRHPVGEPLAQRLLQVERPHQLVHGGGLPAGDHQRLDVVQLARPAHTGCPRPQALEHPQVLADISLDGQDTDVDGGCSHACSLGRASGR
jgi:hypothetical protein